MVYQKALIARHNPKNLCFAQRGELLVPAGPGDVMKGQLPEDHHFFVGVQTGRPSRYGWVKELDVSISAEGLARLRSKDVVDEETIHRCEILLQSAAKLPEGTPMACHFQEIRLPGVRERKLRIHKVFFYQA
jgi:hypothetical protein